MRKKYIYIFVAFLLPLTVSGQDTWTLRECIDYAVENNIEIKQLELSVEDYELDLNTSKNSRLPNLGVSVNQSFSFGRAASPNTNSYEDIRTSHTSATLSAGVPIYSGRRITHQIKSGELNLKAATENLNKAKENLELNVTSLYLETLFRKEILKVYVEQEKLTEEQFERTKILFETGKVPESQLYEVEAQLARDKVNVTVAENDLDMSLLNLKQSLNIVSDSYFDIIEPETGFIVLDGIVDRQTVEQVYQTALGIKPHIKEVEYYLERNQRNVKIARADYAPTVNLGLSYNNGYSYVFSSDFNENFRKQVKSRGNEGIGINVSIPIFSRFQTRNRVRSAELAVRRSELELDNVKLAIYKEIQQAYQSAVAAEAKYVSAEKALESAEESYKYVIERYSAGKATAIELSEAQTRQLTSRSDVVQAKYDYLFRQKILDFYKGERIDI